MKKKHIELSDLYEKVLRLENRVDALEQRPRAGRPPDRMEACVDWLSKLLRKGPVAISYLMRDGKERSFTTIMIRKAGKNLDVASDRKTWRLPS